MTDAREDIAAHYDGVIASYRKYWAPVLSVFSQPLREAARTNWTAPPRILDLGSGPGSPALSLRKPGSDLGESQGTIVRGDLSAAMLLAARENGSGDFHELLVRLDAARLPFPAATFDLIACTFVLQHIREKGRALAEACRVLATGGQLITASWMGKDPGNAAFSAVEDLLMSFGAPEADPHPVPVWTEELQDPESMRRLLKDAGFSDCRVWTETPNHTWTAETLLAYCLGQGARGRRFGRLPPGRQAALRNKARSALESLPPSDFIWSHEVIYVVAEGPDRTD